MQDRRQGFFCSTTAKYIFSKNNMQWFLSPTSGVEIWAQVPPSPLSSAGFSFGLKPPPFGFFVKGVDCPVKNRGEFWSSSLTTPPLYFSLGASCAHLLPPSPVIGIKATDNNLLLYSSHICMLWLGENIFWRFLLYTNTMSQKKTVKIVFVITLSNFN